MMREAIRMMSEAIRMMREELPRASASLSSL